VPVPSQTRITSRQHAVVRTCRAAAAGDDPDLVLLDGEHLIEEALDAGVPIALILSDGRAPAIAARAREAGAAAYEGTTSVLEAASPVRTPSGVVAVAEWRTTSVAKAMTAPEACCLGLLGVQDPGNVGSAIRAADALGATGVLALDGTADPRGWKTLRGSMGSVFHLSVGRGTLPEALAEAKHAGLSVVAAVADGGAPLPELDLRGPALLLVGSEGAGLPAEVQQHADARVTIPMRRGVESLNVAVTAALLLFETRRQRLLP
jgi:TrmH family RNA methyltransferase